MLNNMNAITIPQNINAQGNLVIIPEHEYRAFRAWKKNVKIRLDEEAWFWTPEWQKMEAEADADIRAGKVSGPFSDAKALLKALKK